MVGSFTIMKAQSSNERRDRDDHELSGVSWPPARVGEALRTLARQLGLAVPAEVGAPPPDMESDRFNAWLTTAAESLGLRSDPVLMTLHDVRTIVCCAPPMLLRVQTSDGIRFLAVARGGRKAITVVGVDLRLRRVLVATICEALRRPIEAPAVPEVERLLERIAVSSRRRAQVRALMLAERFATVRFGGCWALQPRPGGGVRAAIREAGLVRGVATLTAAHIVQSVLFVLSWWLLGRGLLTGTMDRGWVLGWFLLLMSLVPFRLATSWMQGRVAIEAGSTLRRRLLRGALAIERQHIRHKGSGQFFGLIVEGAAIESLALNGGFAALLSAVELALAGIVIWLGAGGIPVAILLAWTVTAGWAAWHYVVLRRKWTGARLDLSHLLLEHMVGHRTRLAQQSPDQWHEHEDALLERYAVCGQAMDRSDLALITMIPRGWLVIAVAALAPAALTGPTPERLAVLIGGMLLAYRALRRLSIGLSNLAGAAIAGVTVAPIVRAASRSEAAASPLVSGAADRPDDTAVDPSAALVRDVAFRYHLEGDPVLQGCNMNIPRGARLLLDGPSGSGKTTFASILAGLSNPSSGLVLADGLDRKVLGPAGWRSRVVMAPQPRDNYILSGSLAFNLLMGRGWPARDSDFVEAEEVCRELGLGDLLDRMPGGLHQIVGETGWQLSQGERTRVFLARALLQRPNLLVLDESFSALDPENVDRALRCVLHRAPSVLAIAHP